MLEVVVVFVVPLFFFLFFTSSRAHHGVNDLLHPSAKYPLFALFLIIIPLFLIIIPLVCLFSLGLMPIQACGYWGLYILPSRLVPRAPPPFSSTIATPPRIHISTRPIQMKGSS